MYHQISRNKRASLVVLGGFILAWLGVGVVVGVLVGRGSGLVAGAVVFAIIGVLVAAGGYFFGGGTVLALAGAQPADPHQYPDLHHVVEAIAIGAGIPKPDVYVVEDDAPNAFATGRDPRHAAVTATTGLLAMMDREELEGVVAHELSHIRNYDVRLLLVVTTLIGFAALVGSWLLQATFFAPRGGDDDEGGGFEIAVFVAGLLLLVIGFLVGPLMQFALSRQRELLADASGVELTRNPAGLLSALRKLAANERAPRAINHATAAMYIDNPLEHHARGLSHLFDTHPPIEERIAALERISSAQET